MSEIPKGAIEKARSIIAAHPVTSTVPESVYLDVARFIADVSEKASKAVEQSTFAGQLPAHIAPLQSLILPDPESDLLKEAREICAQREEECGYTFDAAKFRMGNEDDSFAMRCTLAALKGRGDSNV